MILTVDRDTVTPFSPLSAAAVTMMTVITIFIYPSPYLQI